MKVSLFAARGWWWIVQGWIGAGFIVAGGSALTDDLQLPATAPGLVDHHRVHRALGVLDVGRHTVAALLRGGGENLRAVGPHNLNKRARDDIFIIFPYIHCIHQFSS